MPLLSISRRHAPADSVAAIFAGYDRAGGGSASALADYWGTLGGGQPVSILAALAKREIEARFARGERPTALEYLERFPELAGRGDQVVSLVYEEFCLLEEAGAAPSVGQFCERYGPWSDSIASQLGYHRQLSQVAGAAPAEDRYPKVGERFDTYTLEAVLGRGGAAQVYRAVDDLGDRPVVLKVSRTMGLEPSILAALNHDNIVKIHHQVKSTDLGLSGICMPYHPGVTLDAILKSLFGRGDDPRPPRRARALWDAFGLGDLDAATVARYWGGFPARGTYTEAVAWVGHVMAGALHYAHRRGVYHRDIKPANILIARREGPLLFDFNLAHRHSDAARAQDAMSGGTLPYMAPEQLRAFLDPAHWDEVRAGADVYALGLVLRELATGVKPPLPAPGLSLARSIHALIDGRPDLARSIRPENPDVPPALDAIIRKCLAPRAEDRYADAGRLADDLRCFLDRHPLRHAENPSRLELAWNWAYRQRRAAVALTAALLVGGLVALPALRGRAEPPPPPPPYDARKDPRFLEAQSLLQGGDPAGWRKAAEAFKRLSEEHPQTAWPIVYRAFAIDRIGRKQPMHRPSKFTVDLILKALLRDDGVAALESWRDNPDTSKMVTFFIGNYYATNEDHHKAEAYYRGAIEADKNDISAHRGMGDVARAEGRVRDAIAWYGRALTLLKAAKGPGTPSRIHELCLVLVPMELKELDLALEDRSTPGPRPDIPGLLEAIEGHLDQFEQYQDPIADNEPAALETFYRASLRGRFASASGYHLARDRKQMGQALIRFDEAQQLYREADQASKDFLPDAVQPDVPPVNLPRWMDELTARRQRCGLAEEAVPGRPTGDVAPSPAGSPRE